MLIRLTFSMSDHHCEIMIVGRNMIKKPASKIRNQSKAFTALVYAATLRWQIEGSKSTFDIPSTAPEIA